MKKTRDRVIDEWLVLRCQAGQADAFDLLVRRWQRRLWLYARRRTGSDDAAADVTQETWVAVLRQLRRLSDPAWFAAWVYRIVRNKCADYFRKAGRRQRLVEKAAEQQVAEGVLPALGDEAGQAAERARLHSAAEDDRSQAIRQAMEQLSPERRELLMLHYTEGLNVVEIAIVLGVPAGTVKSRLHYAREELKNLLESSE